MLTLELDPATELRLKDRASEEGLEPEGFVTRLVRDAVATPEERKLERLEKFFSAMAQGGENRPPLPEEAFSRDNLYADDGL